MRSFEVRAGTFATKRSGKHILITFDPAFVHTEWRAETEID